LRKHEVRAFSRWAETKRPGEERKHKGKKGKIHGRGRERSGRRGERITCVTIERQDQSSHARTGRSRKSTWEKKGEKRNLKSRGSLQEIEKNCRFREGRIAVYRKQQKRRLKKDAVRFPTMGTGTMRKRSRSRKCSKKLLRLTPSSGGNFEKKNWEHLNRKGNFQGLPTPKQKAVLGAEPGWKGPIKGGGYENEGRRKSPKLHKNTNRGKEGGRAKKSVSACYKRNREEAGSSEVFPP